MHYRVIILYRYIMPTPIQYKSLGEAETCDTRNLPSPTSPNSAYLSYVTVVAISILF